MPKISALPTVTSVTDATAKLVVVEGGVTSSITPAELADDSAWTSRYQPFVERGFPLAAGGTRLGVPGAGFGATATFAVEVDKIYYAPFIVHDTITVDALLCEVTANAGTVARLGILNADTAWQPSGVKKDAGTVGSASTGVKTASFADVSLTAGRYLTALVCDGAATFRVAVGSVPLGELNSSVGANTLIVRHTLASAGTGALSAANDWDTAVGGTSNHQHMVFMRLTGV